MQYRHLGKSGLRVSEIALGSWLTFGGAVGLQEARAIFDQAFEVGINFIDTANVYHRGAAEEVVGEVLVGRPRDSYVLATKAFWPMGDGPNDRGLSRKHIMEQAHASLRRLKTDYVDLYQCHRYDPETPLEETLRALDDLVSQGKALYVGVSEWSATQIADGRHLQRKYGFDPFISNQPNYSMFQRYIEKEVLPISEREGLGQIVFSPLAQGLLTGKYKKGQPIPEGTRAADPSVNQFIKRIMTEERLDQVQRLDVIAKRNDLTLAQLALAWILRQPGVSSAIIGATRPEQVTENAKASGVTLSAEDLAEIETILG